LARVKTTPIDKYETARTLDLVVACPERRAILDGDDAGLLGPVISDEVAGLAAGIDGVSDGAVKDLLRVALIHVLKIAGRRDFAAPSVVEAFRRRVGQVADAASALPQDAPRPSFRLGSAEEIREVGDGEARLVVTSPPYKDLDVEYGLLQIQRPAAG